MERWVGKITLDKEVLAERVSYMFSRWMMTAILNSDKPWMGLALMDQPDFKTKDTYLKYCSGN